MLPKAFKDLMEGKEVLAVLDCNIKEVLTAATLRADALSLPGALFLILLPTDQQGMIPLSDIGELLRDLPHASGQLFTLQLDKEMPQYLRPDQTNCDKDMVCRVAYIM